ncbi:MAG: prepilin-type N-terminal cleavage/methylation domain-containing protein [Deltaproteobacteria bacterium]|nr:prepilin-type N-terminal cleavage/methylation domain-containing protein [Deltaproteobacteria bacterium]
MKSNMEKGFSLLELLVVTALIAVMLAVSVPLLVQQMPKWHMNGTARDVKAKLMMARLRAIQENKTYGVSFTLGAIDSYRVVMWNGASWVNVGVVAEGSSDIDIVPADCVGTRIEFSANSAADGENGCNPASELLAVKVKTTAGGFDERNIYMDTYTGNMKIE